MWFVIPLFAIAAVTAAVVLVSAGVVAVFDIVAWVRG